MTRRRVLLTGCSGGGKSTLIAALKRRGWVCFEEPGQRVIAAGGPAPWDDLPGFLARCVDLSIADFQAAPADVSLFDRGLPDAVLGFQRIGTPRPQDTARLARYRYAEPVLLAPPWPEIFQQGEMRQHGLDAAREEYDHLRHSLPELGYTLLELPKLSLAERVDWVESWLARQV